MTGDCHSLYVQVANNSIYTDLDSWRDLRPENQSSTNLLGHGNNSGQKQHLTQTSLLVGRRDTVGNLGWSWRLDYQVQDKKYDSHYTYPEGTTFLRPLAQWSQYTSHRLGGALDDTYKAGENHLLEFMEITPRRSWMLTAMECKILIW